MLSKALQAAAGNAGEALYIEDTFSTYLYTGNGSTQTITNGIDLATEGGLVWIKQRSSTQPNFLNDTARGATKFLSSNTTDAEGTEVQGLTSFSSSGFSVGSRDEVNGSAATYASWTFRKAEKFFDVVTYTGTGSARTVAHNLGSVPGCIIIKRTDAAGTGWGVYHASLGAGNKITLNETTAAEALGASYWNSTAPTSSVFTVNTSTFVNASGGTYVAYLFAHDAGGFGADGSENVISCGSLTQNSSGNATVTLGYEPQYLLLKKSSGAGDWFIFDTMRGWCVTANPYLQANSSQAESPGASVISPNATGFQISAWDPNTTYIYIAIRRPMKPPTVGTEVFSPVTYTGTGATRSLTAGFPIDLALFKVRDQTLTGFNWFDRLRGTSPDLRSSGTFAELATTTEVTSFASNTQVTVGVSNDTNGTNANGYTYVLEAFKRASGFFDVVCYSGNSIQTAYAHNLGVTPELIIVKNRTATGEDWPVWSPYGTQDNYWAAILNTGAAYAARGQSLWGAGSGGIPVMTSTTFRLGTNTAVNEIGYTYVAYLFATLPGVSKVGSYTGNGSSQTINCGFSGGARFVLIKRTDSTGDWYVWDTARGMVAGNDPHLSLNTTAAEVTTDDSVDTASSGFIVNQDAATNVNVNAATYIYLSIA